MVKISINIEKLVLEGFSYHDHLRITREIKNELSRLVGENGLPEGARRAPVLDTLSYSHNASPKAIGSQIARSIYGSMTQRNE
jgi:hypothetical protein